MPARTFTNQEGTSNKFWTIEVDGAQHTVHYGRHGTAGQVKTKAFADAAKATASAEKLIAEKLAKGYVEDGAMPPPSVAAAATAVAASPPSPAVSTAPAASAAPPTPAVSAAPPTPAVSAVSTAPAVSAVSTAPAVSAAPPTPAPSTAPPTSSAPTAPTPALSPPAASVLRSGIDLRPDEWAWAAWRPLPAAPGLPEPFDRKRAATALRRAKSAQYGWRWLWPEPPFTGPITAEEAGAWLRLAHPKTRDAPSVVARAMADYSGPVPGRGEALELAVDTRLPPAAALCALLAVLGPEPVAEWLVAPECGVRGLRGNQDRELRGSLALGVRAQLLPRLEPADRERFTDAVRDLVARATYPTSYYEHTYPWLLAAQAGLHDELQSTVDGWKDDAYTGEEWLDHYHRPQAIVFGLRSPEAVREAFERLRLRFSEDWHVAGWLAHTETDQLDLAADRIARLTNRDEAAQTVQVLARVHAPAAAPVMLQLMRTSKAPTLAREWLAEHAPEALAGLARTLDGRARPEVVEYLRTRKRAGDDMSIALPHLGEAAAARYRELVIDHHDRAGRELAREELAPELAGALAAAPTKKLPAWLDPVALPPLVPGEEGRLAQADVEAVLRILAAGDPAPAGLGDADAFGWALFEAWLGEGAPPKEKWAMTALGSLGGDVTATKLAPLIRAWPGESQHTRAVLGLGVLGQIGTDTALMLLSGIAEKVKFKALQQRAREAMDEIATAKGMTKSELEDRIVPTCDLDESGSRTFDFGPRSFTFVLGPGMKPMVRDESGRVRASPPKPGARDDEALAAKAVDEWKLLRKQVGDVAKVQAARLEQAMVTQRRWSVEDFERFVVRHPLQRHLARLLVWRDGARTFRVTDELDYAGAGDEPIALQGEIGIVHPLQLSEQERSAWGELLADYEIVPPFPQLGRPVYDIEPGERDAKNLTRFAERKVGSSTLVRMLENLSWQRGQPQDAGFFTLHTKAFPALDMTAVVEYEGVPVGGIVDWEDQAIEHCYVLDRALTSAHELGYGYYNGWGEQRDRVKWGDVDPIVRSEVLADIATIMEKAR